MVTRALALDHNNVAAHHTYALLLMALGRFPEALAHIARAEELDPLSPAIQSNFGRILYRARKFNDAIPRLERALELEPGMQRGVYGRLGDVYDQLGQYERALRRIAFNQNPADQAYQARLPGSPCMGKSTRQRLQSPSEVRFSALRRRARNDARQPRSGVSCCSA
jgi:tetratricopeptide (TPR) repeat protein